MSANLSPEYFAAERNYRQAAGDDERLVALQAMLKGIPKHKGTEKMQADLKTRIARLKKDVLRAKSSGPRRRDPSHVPREGAGQVVLVGAPNCGKSSLQAAVTNARPEIAEYPFTTQKPQPAMMPFENIQIQLVDVPAVSREYTPSWLGNLIRHTDLALLLADAGNDACLENIEAVLGALEELKVQLVKERGADASVLDRIVRVPALLAVGKMDRPGADERLAIVHEFFADQFEILPISTEDEDALSILRRRLFDSLGVIRVCAKSPGKPPQTDKPFVLPQGSTVTDFARSVHKELLQQMQYARIWGDGKYDGQRVPRDYELQDMDVVEIRT